jgi:hypothetical protein
MQHKPSISLHITDVSFTVQPVHLISSCLIQSIIKDDDSHLERSERLLLSTPQSVLDTNTKILSALSHLFLSILILI